MKINNSYNNRKLPPLRAIVIFEMTANFDSFSAAAESMNITHGAISHQIRSLEDFLGCRLFERKKSGGVRLTAEGRKLKETCNISLSHIEDTCLQLERNRQESAGVTIGTTSTILANWLLPFVESLGFQGQRFDISFNTKADLNLLKNGTVDILILSGISNPPDGVDATCMTQDAIGPVCSSLYLKNEKPTTREILGSRIFHASSRPDAWIEWASAIGIDPSQVPSGEMLDTLFLTLEMAVAGLGYAMTPEIVVRKGIKSGQIVAPTGFVAVDRYTYLCTRNGKQNPEVSTLAKQLLSAA